MPPPITAAPARRPAVRRVYTYVLLLAVCGIWGHAAIQLMKALGPADPAETVPAALPVPEALPMRGVDRAAYVGDFRSPFHPPEAWFDAPLPEAPEAAAEAPPQPARPHLTFLGVIDRTALLRDAAGRVHHLSVGDTLAGHRIEGITADQVTACYQGTAFVLDLE